MSSFVALGCSAIIVSVKLSSLQGRLEGGDFGMMREFGQGDVLSEAIFDYNRPPSLPMFPLVNPSLGDVLSGAIFDQNPYKIDKKQ